MTYGEWKNRLDEPEIERYNKAIEDARTQQQSMPTEIAKGRQNIHIVGMPEYTQRAQSLTAKGQYGPSEFYGDIDEAQRLVAE